MTREERHALLGPDVLAHIEKIVDEAPEPSPEVVERLHRIFFSKRLDAIPSVSASRAA
ncbi:hypothetical protein ACFWN1_17920 [Streptomyces sp. NPDC058459]|uniref:hypothetical protein n=1 Tax=Streptomyces sp. NPDC058459 TaxID=3346508 RepID=UPI00365E4168